MLEITLVEHFLSAVFTQKTSDQLAALGEVALIQEISKWLGDVNPSYPTGIGDDCAVLPANQSGEETLITTDSLTYGQHIDDQVSAKSAGAKLIKRNLSDIAAMGGVPQHAVLALLCGPDVAVEWLREFFEGIRETCKEYSLQLVGGDVSALAPGHFSSVLTLVGRTAQPKLRQSSQVGDRIYVTGTLGGSILEKHYSFKPRLGEGQWLASLPECTALMDLTDGLGKDLHALLPVGSSAAIDVSAIPISSDAHLLAQQSGKKPLEHAYCDGEDYELLFTMDTSAADQFESAWRGRYPQLELTCIGVINESDCSGRIIDSATKTALELGNGFEHLCQK